MPFARPLVALTLCLSLAACQAPTPVAPAEASTSTLKGSVSSPAETYRIQRIDINGFHGGVAGLHLSAIGQVGPAIIYLVQRIRDRIAKRKRRYEVLSQGEPRIEELVIGPDGSFAIEIPAGPVSIKLLMEDGTLVPLTFPSGEAASHWLNAQASGTYDLGLVGAVDIKQAQAEKNPLGLIDTDGDGVPDALDPDDDGDGTPDTAEVGAMRYDPTETQDTDRDGLGDNADPSPTDAGYRGEAVPADLDGDGLIDHDDADGDGKLDLLAEATEPATP